MTGSTSGFTASSDGKLDERFGKMLGELAENPSFRFILANTGALVSRMTCGRYHDE